MASRRLPVLAVLVVSQVAAFLALALLAATVGGDFPSTRRVVYGVVAGAAGFCGLIAFYRALKIGAMGVVTPIAATAVLVPVTVGLAHGERPSALQGAGVALALGGVVAASLEPEREALHDRRLATGVGLALVAAILFGSAVTGLNAAAKGGPIWATFSMRAAAAPLSIVLVLASRAPVRDALASWPLLAAIGIVDAGATILFGFAGNRGLLSVVAVLASLYPVVVAILARVFLGERLTRLQLGGAVVALVGVALISAG